MTKINDYNLLKPLIISTNIFITTNCMLIISLNPVPNAQVCVYLTVHITNYNYKLHFQNLCTYHIPHVSIGTLVAKNLDVCTACDL